MFLALLLPLAGALSALLMAIAIRCRSVKEAQANATALVLVVSLLPLLTLFNQEGEAPWHLWVPALAQITLMGRVLKGEPIAAWELALPLVMSVLLVALCLAFVARTLARAALSDSPHHLAAPRRGQASGVADVQRALHLALPGQRVHDLVEEARRLQRRQHLALFADQPQVGDHRHRVGHGDHVAGDLHPIPGDAGFAVVGLPAPDGLAGGA